MSQIKLENVTKTYKNGKVIYALRDFSICVEKGEMVAIMGESGAGKTTLMNIIGFLEKPTLGEYLLDGVNTKNYSEKIRAEYRNSYFGFVVQNYALIHDFSVKKNLQLPFEYCKKHISKREKEKKTIEMLEAVGLSHKINNIIYELSGGEKQRLAIGRAMIMQPKVLLADEPTGALDIENGRKVMSMLKEIRNLGRTVIIVTHDINIAKQCDRIVQIKKGRSILQ